MTGDELCTCGHILKEHDGEDFECECGCEYFEEVPRLRVVPSG